MHPLELLLVPATLLLITGLLILTTRLEQAVLSPRSLILRTVRVRNAPPEHVEKLVAAQYERLLRENSKP